MRTETQQDWTHYERLGVAEDATPAEIRGAHRSLVKDLHSDRKHGPYRDLFEELTKQLNVARDTLLDPARRRRYDADLAARRLAQRRENARTTAAGSRRPDATAGHKTGPGGDRGAGSARGRQAKSGAERGGGGGTSSGRGPSGEKSGGAPGGTAGATQGQGDGPRPRTDSGPGGRREGDRDPDGSPAGSRKGAGARPGPLAAFTSVERHPRAHLFGASAAATALYLLAMVAAGAAWGAFALTAVVVGFPIAGLVVPRLARRAGLPAVALLARALWIAPLILLALVLALQLVPAGNPGVAGVLELAVNVAFVAAGIYPALWIIVGALAVGGRVLRRLAKLPRA